nr:YSIRK-type signal peptide-containing protein [Ipomoea batatas]
MTPLSMTDLSELKIGRKLRMRTGTRATKKILPKKPKKRVDPSSPFPFSEPPKPNTPNDSNAIPSPSSPAAPARFTKVTNWETMQRFNYELHMEHENLLEQRDARHYELIQDLSMQIAFLREELARRGPSSGF